jgi:hypothetical protein
VRAKRSNAYFGHLFPDPKSGHWTKLLRYLDLLIAAL